MGLVPDNFAYPIAFKWLVAVFIFWIFFVSGALLALLRKRSGWILTNSLLLFCLGYLGFAILTHDTLALHYEIVFILILSTIILLSRRSIFNTFFPSGRFLMPYILSVVITVVWLFVFYSIDKH